MSKIDIGISFYLQKLIETCMLIQASRGGGKSYLVRKMLETISGKCQQIVIDLEGEFVTLREKYPFALLSVEGGDLPLNVRHAGTYAQKLMETGMSVIVDLSDLKPADRAVFVRDFLHALMNLPKHLYHPLLVYIDEGHIFCPQDEGAVSYEAVIDVAARGRKRDIGLVLATQRVSKLHKDVTAELLNKVIGRTGQDIDQARAAKELDWKPADKSILRKLDPGSFFCFGPAFQDETVQFTVSQVTTSHKKTSIAHLSLPPTPEAIKSILQTLKDMPEEAEKELISRQQLQAEVARLKTELSKASRGIPAAVKPTQGNAAALQVAINKAVKAALDEMRKSYEAVIKTMENQGRAIHDQVRQMQEAIAKINEISARVGTIVIPRKMPEPARGIPPARPISASATNRPPDVKTPSPTALPGEDRAVGKCAKAILAFLAAYEDRKFTRTQVAIATNYSVNSGGFKNALSELNSQGLIVRGDRLTFNPDAWIKIKGIVGNVVKGSYDINTFKQNLGKCEAEIYDVLLEAPHDQYTKESLAAQTPSNYSPDSGGFKNSLSRLTTLELIVRDRGRISLNPELLELL